MSRFLLRLSKGEPLLGVVAGKTSDGRRAGQFWLTAAVIERRQGSQAKTSNGPVITEWMKEPGSAWPFAISSRL